MLTIDTTYQELKNSWKKLYRRRKALIDTDSNAYHKLYGYLTGKMEYVAWLIINTQEYRR